LLPVQDRTNQSFTASLNSPKKAATDYTNFTDHLVSVLPLPRARFVEFVAIPLANFYIRASCRSGENKSGEFVSGIFFKAALKHCKIDAGNSKR
jgi:hypothetical protein